jgi:hypothetical protein
MLHQTVLQQTILHQTVLPLFEFKSGLESQQNVKALLVLFCIILLPKKLTARKSGEIQRRPLHVYTSPGLFTGTHTLLKL